MTVAELRDLLATLPGDMSIVLSRDAEGNGHSPLAGGEQSMYLAETTWSGEVYMTPEEIASRPDADPEEDAAPDGAVRVLLLWPVN